MKEISIFRELLFLIFFMFEFPCIVSLYYIRNQQDAIGSIVY